MSNIRIIDTENKTPLEAVNELIEEMKQMNPQLFEEAAKRPRIKRDTFILKVGIESDLDLMELKKLIAKALKPLNENGIFKGMTFGTLVEYEQIEFHMTDIEGHNNGSGCNFWMEKGNPNSD